MTELEWRAVSVIGTYTRFERDEDRKDIELTIRESTILEQHVETGEYRYNEYSEVTNEREVETYE